MFITIRSLGRVCGVDLLRSSLRGLLAFGFVVVVFACSDDEHVGSRDCAVIKQATADPATHQACDTCSNQPCETAGCEIFPCVDGRAIVQGCEEDSDCSAFAGTRCGKYSAPDKVCSTHPDNQ
jgi:hypothetical protein